jgi:DinB superfamily
MNAGLQRMVVRLERQKAALVRRIEAWPHDWLADKPAPSEWSALEVLDHLRKTELAVLHSCETNLKSRHHVVSPYERGKALVFLAMMRLPIKVRVPEPVSFVLPGHVISLHTVLESWAAERALLKAFLEPLTASTENVGLVFHPAVGWMNLTAAMSFLSVHLRHHEYQLRRIKKAYGGIQTLGANPS